MIRDVSACVYLLGGGLAQVILAAALITFRPAKTDLASS